MTINEAAALLADQAYEQGQEVETIFMKLRKKQEGEVWEFASTLSFEDQMNLLERAERKYGS